MAANVRHFAAPPVSRAVRAIARVARVEDKSILFEVGHGTAAARLATASTDAALSNVADFEKRFGVTTAKVARA
jgi:fluoroacetyl-CoA thioesterase